MLPGKSVRLGCSGWSYKKWSGKFYPADAKNSDMLKMYTQTFNTVEVDSTFYGMPSRNTVEKWFESTSPDFRFCLKLDRQITHIRMLQHCEPELENFLDRVKGLKEKLGPVLIQLPPFFKYDLERLESFIEKLPGELGFVFEFREDSWFNRETEVLLRKNHIAAAWSDSPFTEKVLWNTGNFLYLRLVGDRTIDDQSFGTVVRQKNEEIKKWGELIRDSETRTAYIFANNHYEGFSPHTASRFAEALNLKRPMWPIGTVKGSGQRTLF